MSILKGLQEDIKSIIEQAGYSEDRIYLEESNRKDLGEYQLNDAMQLTKIYHENPREIASKIVSILEKDNRFTNINIAGPGFINISLSDEYIYDFLNKMKDDIFINIDKREKKKVIIDYGGANVAKALHVGHLRSANIGEALKRLSRTLGYEVLGDAHLGDYGRPLGFVVLEIMKKYKDLPFFDKSYTGNFEEITLPITNEDLEKLYPIASQKAKEDPIYLEEGREVTSKIQNHERGYYDLWKKVVEISKKDIKEVYDILNTEFDLWLGESDAENYLDELTSIFEEKNLLMDSEGAKIIDVSKEEDTSPMPPLLYLKSNGTISYETTDLATILQRKKEFNPDEIWYVVDGRQSLHFEQTFRAARLAKLVDDNVNLEHVDFGTMNGKDKKPFKTRDGGVMTLKSLIELVKEETRKKIVIEATEEEKEEISKTVAIAALKYADLLPFRSTDYIFELEKFSDLEGKTGSYILYSTIRMKSLLNKEDTNKREIIKLKGQTEREIALLLLNLKTVIDKAMDTKSLNEIADYLYKLTSLYNSFYSDNRILTESNEELKISWITLTQIVYNTNMMLLDILGIKVPKKM